MSQTIQQQRAKYALQQISRLQDTLTQEQQKNLVSYATSLPAMIHMNGLGQAMAFCKTKGSNKGLDETDDKKRSYNALYQIVSDWLCQKPQVYQHADNVLQGITEQSLQDYQLAQTETLLLMSWVNKFAKAFLAEEENT